MKELATSLNAQSMVVSAYTNQNINEAFDLMALELVTRFKDQIPKNGQQLN